MPRPKQFRIRISVTGRIEKVWKKIPMCPELNCRLGICAEPASVLDFTAIGENNNVAEIGERLFMTFRISRYQFRQADLGGRAAFFGEEAYCFVGKGVAHHRSFVCIFTILVNDRKGFDGLLVGISVAIEGDDFILCLVEGCFYK